MSSAFTRTIDAIWSELGRDGFVPRYSTAATDEGHLTCSFWLVSVLILKGPLWEGAALLERLLGLTNDLGLLVEEYDVKRRRQVGNFPQVLSHLTLVVASRAISAAEADTERPAA